MDNLLSHFPEKTITTVFLVVLMDARTIIFFCFCWLVILDCFTRWLALGHEYLIKGGADHTSLFKCFKAIPGARRAGLIRSEVMREQGVDKLILYMLCTLGASLCDLIFMELHAPAWTTSFVVGYMAVTEVLSIVENLSDAGVESLHLLAEKLKRRL